MKKWVCFILVFGCIICFFNLDLRAILYGNQVPFVPERSSFSTDYVSRGASHYFLALVEINKFFSEVEIDLDSGKEFLDNALKYLNLSIHWYSLHKENMSISDDVFNKYKDFNYSIILKKPGFNKTTVSEVISYFKKADIEGFWSKLIQNLEGINQTINKLKISVSKNDLWSLYEMTSNRFGYYGTIITEEIFN
jgi:hypothetical protein